MMKPDPWYVPRPLAAPVGVLLRDRGAKKSIPDKPECSERR